jgi:hypothetical protein
MAIRAETSAFSPWMLGSGRDARPYRVGMTNLRARGPTTIDLGQGTPDDFERVCFLIVAIEFPEIVRLKNPDGGIEFGLPDDDGEFSHCWQAKRYTTGGVAWIKCEASLDSALEHFGMPHYTFCFPFDLTVGQHKKFRTRLGKRHEGVTVDYLNHSKLESVLLSTAQGERIVNHFYADRADNMRRFTEALRAGGPMESGADVFERLDAIAEFLATNDPYYSYVTVTGEIGVERPGITPSTMLSLEVSNGQSVTRIDAVARNPAALQRVPEGMLWFDDTPKGREDAEKFNRVMQVGGDLQIDDARFELRNLPPLLESMGGSEGLGTLLLRAPKRSIPPWDARFVIDTDRGRAEVDVLLEQCDPPDRWDAAVAGTFGGLTMMVMFRTGLTKGAVGVHWSYGYTVDYAIRDQALALAAIDAIQGVGKVEIEDRDGRRSTSTFTLVQREVDMHQVLLRRFMESLITIEDWTGHQFTLPDLIPEVEVRAAIEAAQVIRSGESEMTFDQIELVMPAEKYDEISTGPGRYAIGYRFGVELLGDEVWIGELRGEIPEVETETHPIVEEGEEKVQLLVRPVTDKGRKPTFKLFPPHSALPSAESLASDA